MEENEPRSTDIEGKLEGFEFFGYVPHSIQRVVHQKFLEYRNVVVAAGARGGKSMLAGAEILWEFTKPNKHIWCVSSQYDLADKPLQWFMEFGSKLKLNDTMSVVDCCRISCQARGSQVIRSPWGSWVKTKSTEKPAGLLGEELDLIVIDEASQVRREPWDRMLSMRVVSRKGKVLVISTPNSDGGLFMDLFEKGTKPDQKEWFSIQFPSWDNPYLDRHELELAKARMSDANYKEQIMGQFVSRRGKVFVIAHCVLQELPHIADMPVILGVRYQLNNPFVVVFIAIDQAKREYIVFDEIYLEHGNPQAVNDSVLQKIKGRRLIAKITEDDKGKQEVLSRAGLQCTCIDEKKYKKQFCEIKRVQMLQNLLKEDNVRFKIYKECRHTIEDFEKATWADEQREKGRAEIELPLSGHMHAPLACSYPLSFIEAGWGVDVYGSQIKKKGEAYGYGNELRDRSH